MDDTRFGLPIAIWDVAKEEARAILIERAKKTDLITYSELAWQIRSFHFERDDYRLFGLIGDISEEEDKEERGMLSALVVTKEKRMPGDGFFELAKKCGHDVRDHLEFWTNEVKRVYATWDK